MRTSSDCSSLPCAATLEGKVQLAVRKPSRGAGGKEWQQRALGTCSRPWDLTLKTTNVRQNPKCHSAIYIGKTLNMGFSFTYWLKNGHNHCLFFLLQTFQTNLEKVFEARRRLCHIELAAQAWESELGVPAPM